MVDTRTFRKGGIKRGVLVYRLGLPGPAQLPPQEAVAGYEAPVR